MSDYISRQAAFEALEKRGVSTTNISRVPIADVRENVRGEWIFPYGDKKYKRCSVCGRVFYSIPYNTNFCPECGADMRGEKNEIKK